MSYFIRTWDEQLSNETARKRAQAAIHAIDSEAELVCVNVPGNSVRMWLERPNDGCNDYLYMRARHQKLVAVVERELSKAAVAK